jgi:hypothetical protein
MHLKDIASKAGVFLLAVLMLSAASGIHSGICHVSPLTQETNDSCAFAKPETCDQQTSGCNACYFNQILTQCVFSIIGTIHISESVLFHEAPFPKAALGRVLELVVNRSPPAAIVLP